MGTGPESYDLTASRQARVADPADLVGPLEQLVRAIQQEGPLFALWGHSPAFHKYEVLQGDTSLVPNFLMTSEIQWGSGREPQDPTHQVVFFNGHRDDRRVYLRVAFSVEKPEDGVEVTGPGLVAELSLGPDAAGADESARAARLDRLLNLMAELFAADSRRVEARDADE